MPKTYCVVIEHDQCPDMSWLEQDHYDPRSPTYAPTYRDEAAMKHGEPLNGDWYRDPDNHVALAAVAYDEDGNVLDSVGGIDFLCDSDDWGTGTFYRVCQLPAGYLRDIAKEMGLPD